MKQNTNIFIMIGIIALVCGQPQSSQAMEQEIVIKILSDINAVDKDIRSIVSPEQFLTASFVQVLLEITRIYGDIDQVIKDVKIQLVWKDIISKRHRELFQFFINQLFVHVEKSFDKIKKLTDDVNRRFEGRFNLFENFDKDDSVDTIIRYLKNFSILNVDLHPQLVDAIFPDFRDEIKFLISQKQQEILTEIREDMGHNFAGLVRHPIRDLNLLLDNETKTKGLIGKKIFVAIVKNILRIKEIIDVAEGDIFSSKNTNEMRDDLSRLQARLYSIVQAQKKRGNKIEVKFSGGTLKINDPLQYVSRDIDRIKMVLLKEKVIDAVILAELGAGIMLTQEGLLNPDKPNMAIASVGVALGTAVSILTAINKMLKPTASEGALARGVKKITQKALLYGGAVGVAIETARQVSPEAVKRTAIITVLGAAIHALSLIVTSIMVKPKKSRLVQESGS